MACMCSPECHYLSHTSAALQKVDNLHRNKFHYSPKRCFVTSDVEHGSLFRVNQFYLLLHLNLNFLMFAFRLVDSDPICQRESEIHQLKSKLDWNKIQSYRGSGTGGNVACVLIVIPPIDIAPKVCIPLMVWSVGYPWKMADDGRVGSAA
jgi:hypothetical protein